MPYLAGSGAGRTTCAYVAFINPENDPQALLDLIFFVNAPP